jgi:hypothetical protein
MFSSLLLGVALQIRAMSPAPLPPGAAVAPTPTTSAAVSSDTLTFHARDGGTTVPMSRPIDATIVVDGNLDEPVWQRARRLTGFSLYTPVDQRPSPDSTDVLVWYSKTAIHFGIRAFEPHGAVRATLADRDRVSTDDNVELHLDTFEEKRRAFVFIVNPLGIQADGTKNEAGGFIPGSNVSPGQNDLSADFQWQSRGKVTADGYEVEIRIPFSSLRYPVGGEQRWGLQIVRKVQHSGYEETWTPVRRGAASFVAQEGWLTGLTDMHHGVDVTLNPELTTTIAGTPCCSPANDAWKYTNTPRLGGNVRAGLGSNVVVVGTIRPDFSQVEADATQVAADQRFALFYPERRPFFVEGSDQFNVPNTLVYTRRIVQPDAALKLNARQGRTNVALLSALDLGTPATATTKRDRPLVDILRITRDFSGQSTAGLVYSERIGRGNENRMVGSDVKFLFGRMYFAQAQFAASQSRTAGVSKTGALWEGVVDRTGRAWGFHYNLLGIRPDFRADNGFVARTGFTQLNAANRVTLFGKQGALVERYMVFVQTSGLWRYRDFFEGKSLLESKASLSNTFTLRRGWSVSVSPGYSTYAFDPAAFSGLATENGTAAPDLFAPSPRITVFSTALSVSTPQYRRFAASAGVTSANDVDFLETSRVRRTAYNGSLDLRPNERLRVNATYASNEFTRRFDGRSSFSTRIPRVKIEYQVARPIFVRVISQYEANRREALVDYRTGLPLLVRQSNGTYAPSVTRASNLLRADWLFSYRPRPGTVLFAGYGSSMTEPGALEFDRLRRVSDGVFLKASWLFTPPTGR